MSYIPTPQKKFPIPEALSSINLRDFCRGMVHDLISTSEWRALQDAYDVYHEETYSGEEIKPNVIVWDDDIRTRGDQYVTYTISLSKGSYLNVKLSASKDSSPNSLKEANALYVDVNINVSGSVSVYDSADFSVVGKDYLKHVNEFKVSMVEMCVEALDDLKSLLETV